MKKVLLTAFHFFLLSTFLFAQPVNDLCVDAIEITDLDNNCINFNVLDGSANIANGDCVFDVGAFNVWYKFTAQGSQIQITGDGPNENVFATLVEFNPNICEFESAGQLACGKGDNGGVLIDYNGLVPGNEYYIIMNVNKDNPGNAEFCINNPVSNAPPNDESCGPSVVADDCSPISGTTIDATADFSITGSCAPSSEVGVFYEFTLAAGYNSVTIDALNLSSNGDITVVLGTWASDCNGDLNILDIYCGPSTSDALDVSSLSEGTTYVVYVATSQADQGTFDLTICGSGPPPGCSDNDFCNDAEVFPTIQSNTAYVCVDGCNIGASSESALAGCNMATQEVVWFQFDTDNNATLATVYINSDDIEAPTLQVFSGSCSGLTQVTDCVTGADNFAQLVNFGVSTNTSYWIAVSNDFGDGGEFELCVQTLDDPSSCVLSSNIEVVSTSLGSPLAGPFQPEEEVQFCYTINSYTSSGNNCQWLQGIIPVFGCGWDDASFDANGMPVNITNPITTQYGGFWGWYTDVTYNNATSVKSVGDFDGDGNLEMCHYTEPNCSNSGIAAGDIMPGGWYNANPADGPPNGHPNIDYGDGNACNTTMGPWTVCFILTTKDLEACEECTEATVKIYTTADGETGSWNGGSSICANDIPVVFDGVLNCCIGPELQQPLTQTICSGETSLLELFSNADPGATYNYTPLPNSSISGAAAGSGKFISNTLINNSTVLQTQIYEVIPIDETGCPGLPQQVTIDVLPQIIVDAGPDIDGCAQGEFTLGGNPTATGGSGAPYNYEWSNPSFGNDPNPTASPNLTTTYVVTVTDLNGCTNTDDIVLNISPVFDVEISGDTTICQSDVLQLTAAPLGGTPDYSYEWNGPSVSGSGSALFLNEYSLYPGTTPVTVTVTDQNGCTGTEDVNVIVNQAPNIFFFPTPESAEFCPGGSVTILAVADATPGATLTFEWDGPEGTKDGESIIVMTAGTYTLSVTDDFGCVGVKDIEVTEVPEPEPEIVAPNGLCPNAVATLSLTEEYDSYVWQDASSESTIEAVAGSTYSVTVVNSAGCTGTDEVTITAFEEPDATIAGSTSFCVGSSTTLSAVSGYTSYLWKDSAGNDISTEESIVVNSPGEITLIVVNSDGCENTSTVNVEVKDFLVPVVSGDSTLCPDECSTLDAGLGFSSYSWSNNESSQSIEVCAAGSYTVTVEDASGCTGETTVNVIINTPPNPDIQSSSDDNLCPEESTILSLTESYASYEWNDLSTNPTLAVDTAGNYSVTVVDEEGCTGTDEFLIIQNSIPEPTFTGETGFCPGGSTQITPESGYVNYEIDLDNNGSIDIVSSTPDPYTVNVAGNSKIIVTDANGCKGEVLVPVTIYDAPTPETTLDQASFCTGGSVTISLKNNYTTVEWTAPDNSNAGSGQSISANQNGTYTILVTDDNGCTGTTSMEVIESTELSPAITGDERTCDNAAVTLDAGSGYDKYEWSNSEDTQTIEVTTTGEYAVTVYDAGGCSGTATFDFQNFDTPEVTVQSKTVVCNNIDSDEGVIVNFTNLVSGADGFWTDLDGSGVDLSDLTQVSFESITPGFYIFVYETTTAVTPCENVKGTVEIEVKECLCPSLQLDPFNDLCVKGSSIDLNTFKITSEDGVWSITSGPGGDPLQGSIFDPTKGFAGQYVVRFTLDETKEDCPEFTEQILTVIEAPKPGVATDPYIVCIGTSDNIALSDLLQGEDQGGDWKDISDVEATSGIVAGIFNPVNENLGTYTFQYLVAGQSPCLADSSTVNVIVVPNPTADAGDDQLLNCTVEEVQLSGNSQGSNLSYSWSEIKGTPISSPTNPNIVVKEEGVYLLEVKDINSCVDLDTALVTRNTNFPELIAEGIDPLCFNQSNGKINLSTSGGQGDFEYSIDNGANWVPNTGFLDLAAGTYTLQVKDANGCTSTAIVNLNNPTADEIDLGNDLQLINEDSITLNYDYNGNLESIVAAVWKVDGSTVCEGKDCLEYLLPLGANNYEVCVEITTEDGCMASDCIFVRNSKIQQGYVPNVFSPNGDANNDVFYVQGNKDLVQVNSMKIFDRWGELIFTNENFKPNDPKEGWDGTFKGESLNPAVFVYLIEIAFDNGEIQKIEGDVTLIK